MCTIHLDQCPPPVTSTQGPACYCSAVSANEDEYHFIIRQSADAQWSERNLIAQYSSTRSLTDGINVFAPIGKLPLMFSKFPLSHV